MLKEMIETLKEELAKSRLSYTNYNTLQSIFK